MVEEPNLTDDQISKSLSLYGFSASAPVCDQIRTYIGLLLRWNQKISLTAIVDRSEVLRLHFGESVFAVKNVPAEKGRLADVGSGAGFPGIPIAMASPQIQATLIEPNQRKAAFLSEVVRSLKLPNVIVLRSRIEDVDPKPMAFDFITARAVGQHEELLRCASRFLTRSGKLVLWVGGEDAKDLPCSAGWLWRHPILIPQSRSRVLLVGSPARRDD